MACDLWRCIFFLLFLGFSARLDVTCSQPFSHHVKFHSFMFMNKIPTRLVCVNGKPSLKLSQTVGEKEDNFALHIPGNFSLGSLYPPQCLPKSITLLYASQTKLDGQSFSDQTRGTPKGLKSRLTLPWR